ncbi:polyphosphate:nucleotide phosphotransferase, PPK2 family [Kytococcus aerolatus]|uniref:Polyphosphate:nucleotide phosphotransferase, PPK2 family n=1 Tax=Kytococcus aerolatus TaxID=592308 RepID=A0A212T3L8_9MICO|nr:polyphosphate kinase 2 family protein [Kytococcus aerolatus]SNC60431.1 polyphosphate:nucleotide phosphotransferase, PPK2 family [Kytococcus aerolatus]
MTKKKPLEPDAADLDQAVEEIAPGATPFSDALRVGTGFRLADVDPRSTPAFDGDKADGQLAMHATGDELADLQERLWANGARGDRRRLLLLVQGMDTSGKGGVMRHVVGAMDPQGIQITAFKSPTAEELEHDFLWRIRKALPDPGHIGVFDRSHYEDVLIVRVHDLVPRDQWQQRYTQINAFERELARQGITLVKVMLHISPEEQAERLMERLERPDKHWKFNPGDLDEREHWADYQEAYQVALSRCSTKGAPWFVVPADRKWYARLAVQQLVLEHLRAMDLEWPEADFDVEAATERLQAQVEVASRHSASLAKAAATKESAKEADRKKVEEEPEETSKKGKPAGKTTKAKKSKKSRKPKE